MLREGGMGAGWVEKGHREEETEGPWGTKAGAGDYRTEPCCALKKERGGMEESKTQRLALNGVWSPCWPGDPGTLGGGGARAGSSTSCGPQGSSLSLLQEAKA